MSDDASNAADGDPVWLPTLDADGKVTNALCIFCDGQIVYITEMSARWMGATSVQEIIGRLLTDVVPAEQMSMLVEMDQHLKKTGDRTPRMFSTFIRLDGTRVDNDIVVTLIDWEGRPAYQIEIYDISPRSAVEKSVEYGSAMIEHASDALIATTFNGIITSWNPAAAAIFAVAPEDAIGQPITQVADSRLDLRSILLGGGVEHFEIPRNDIVAWIRVSVSVMHIGYVVVCADNSTLRRAERRFQAILETLDGGLVVIGPDGTIESANPAAIDIYGADPRGMNWDDLVAATIPFACNTEGQVVEVDPIADTRHTGKPLNGLIIGYDRGSSKRIWVSMSCRRLDSNNSADTTVLMTLVDFTEHQLARQRLAHAATHDHLTDLHNRAHLLRILQAALRAKDEKVRVVLFIDLDNLKSTNDSLGHGAGDYVLRMAAQRLRESVGPNDVVARHGGDEFICLLHLHAYDEVESFCNRIHESLAQAIRFDGIDLLTGACIGVRVLTDEDSDAAAVVADADLAMYEAKAAGRNQIRMFTRV